MMTEHHERGKYDTLEIPHEQYCRASREEALSDTSEEYYMELLESTDSTI
jgi:hypothetical protein